MITAAALKTMSGAAVMAAVVDILRDEIERVQGVVRAAEAQGWTVSECRAQTLASLIAAANAIESIKDRGMSSKDRKVKPEPIVEMVADILRSVFIMELSKKEIAHGEAAAE